MTLRFLIGLTSLLLHLQIYAMPIRDADLTLTPPPPPKPTVLGVQFGSSPKEVIQFMSRQRVALLNQETFEGGARKTVSFEGLPPGLAIKEGRTHFAFYRNQLVKINLEFTPSYENFLIIRDQLFNALDDRFVNTVKQESMDVHLRQRLANLSGHALGGSAENLVRSSIDEGKTFYLYRFEDQRKELDIIYSYTRASSGPTLTLRYSHRRTLEEAQGDLPQATMGGSHLPSLVPQN